MIMIDIDLLEIFICDLFYKLIYLYIFMHICQYSYLYTTYSLDACNCLDATIRLILNESRIFASGVGQSESR
jgi:hypothetical protein